MNEYLTMWKNYANFTGRSTRSEYGFALLINIMISALLVLICPQLGITWLASLYGFAIFLPNLALQIRRLHDIGKSGFWAILLAVPFVGVLLVLYLVCKDSV